MKVSKNEGVDANSPLKLRYRDGAGQERQAEYNLVSDFVGEERGRIRMLGWFNFGTYIKATWRSGGKEVSRSFDTSEEMYLFFRELGVTGNYDEEWKNNNAITILFTDPSSVQMRACYKTFGEFFESFSSGNVLKASGKVKVFFNSQSGNEVAQLFENTKEFFDFVSSKNVPPWLYEMFQEEKSGGDAARITEPSDSEVVPFPWSSKVASQKASIEEDEKDAKEQNAPAPEGSLQQYLEMVVGKAARSGKHGFKVTDKLEEVERILADAGSPYHVVRKSDQSWIFGQKGMEDGQSVLMVSTHADIVDYIKNPHSNLHGSKDYYRGTYDNAGTNAVCAHLMGTEKLPSDVYFAFTAEEETGRCSGAADALSFVRETTGKEPIVLALDVTDEGYDNDRLFTVEGLHGVNELSRRKMLDVFLSTEGSEQSFEVIKLSKKDDNSFLPQEYQGKGTTVFDESVFYARQGCNSCSICLPGDGEMHGDSGFKVKRAVMEGYEASLLAAIYAFERENPEKISELKERKDALVAEARSTEFWNEGFFSSYGSSFYGGNYQGSYGSYYDSSYYDDYGLGSYTQEDEEGYIFQQAVEDAQEMALSYSPEEFEEFFADIVGMYGIKDDENSRLIFNDIFEECMEMKAMCDEDDFDPYDLCDYGVEM